MKINNKSKIIKIVLALLVLIAAIYAGFAYYKSASIKNADFASLEGEVTSCKMSNTQMYKYIDANKSISLYGEHSEYIPCAKDGSGVSEMCEALLANIKCGDVVYRYNKDAKDNVYTSASHDIIALINKGIAYAKANPVSASSTDSMTVPEEKNLYRDSKGRTIKLSNEKGIYAGTYVYTAQSVSTTGEWAVDESSTKARIVLLFAGFENKDTLMVKTNTSLQIVGDNNKVVNTFFKVSK